MLTAELRLDCSARLMRETERRLLSFIHSLRGLQFGGCGLNSGRGMDETNGAK